MRVVPLAAQRLGVLLGPLLGQLLGLGAGVAAPCQQPQPFSQNRLEFGNFWLSPREDLFPNYLGQGGNVAGDGLFKVFPAEVLERHGDHQISGYKVTISVDDAYTGAFPVQVQVPGVQFYRTVVRDVGGTVYETLDPSRPVGPAFPPLSLMIVTDNAWEVEVPFSPGASHALRQQTLAVPARPGGRREGLAMLVLAPPGEGRSASTPGIVLQSTFGERHVAPSRGAYSGSYDAATGTVAMFGQTGQPSARGELAVGLRFSTPTLQVFGDSAGGFPDPNGFETFLGPGAYGTDLASSGRSGFFGLLVQDQEHHVPGQPPSHMALPFVVATSLPGPTAGLQVGGVTLRIAPGETGLANALVGAGFFGPLDTYRAAGPAGHDTDLEGVYQTGRIPVQLDPSFVGTVLWFQALITDQSLLPVATTNAVRMTVQ